MIKTNYKFPIQDHIFIKLINSYNTNIMKEAKYRLAFQIMYYTGLRVSDTLNLKWSNINQDNITKIMKKTKVFITIPINHKLKYELENYKKKYKINDWVFYASSNASKHPNIQASSLRFEILRFRRKYDYNNDYMRLNQLNGTKNLKKLCNHAFRHNFAQRIYDNSNNDIYLVKDLLGHKDIKTTARYLDTSFSKKKAIIESL